ncbi:MAG: AAA family ATPase [Saprospiraceae bacterium]|jgi:ATP-dependent exoDNAse (exonuclease V) alpha subunit|nr:AAA family ATPase [Saprospiraceae bacterium]MBK8296300.1 AAA family ATPase [Saprospiraceae bacterium]
MDDSFIFQLNPEHHYVLDQLDSLKGCLFLTGRAGTGKSSLIQLFKKLNAKRVIYLAPTGVAAVQIKGQTIHSFFKFPPGWIRQSDYKILPKKFVEQIDLIFIDEISMVRAELLDHIDQLLQLSIGNKKPFGGKAMLWCGDLFQLPPVVSTSFEKDYFQNEYASPYFFSAKVFNQIESFELIELNRIYRQSDPYFIKLLEKIRMNDLDSDELEEINELCCNPKEETDVLQIHLCTTNASANRINMERLQALEDVPKIYKAKIKGQVQLNQYPGEEQLILKVGAQVVFTRNDPTKRFVNGSLGVVLSLNENSIEIEMENKRIELEAFTWEIIKYKLSPGKNKDLETEVVGHFIQFPIKLAWAITIHKSQGKTFEHIAIEMGSGAFEFGQAYVAFSRCKSLQGIQLKQKLRWQDIRTDERIIDFLRQHT